MYTKSHKPTHKPGFYYSCHSWDFLAGVVSQNSHKANSYRHFFHIFSCHKCLKLPVLSWWQMTQLTKNSVWASHYQKKFPRELKAFWRNQTLTKIPTKTLLSFGHQKPSSFVWNIMLKPTFKLRCLTKNSTLAGVTQAMVPLSGGRTDCSSCEQEFHYGHRRLAGTRGGLK